jgi:hypothetical protein
MGEDDRDMMIDVRTFCLTIGTLSVVVSGCTGELAPPGDITGTPEIQQAASPLASTIPAPTWRPDVTVTPSPVPTPVILPTALPTIQATPDQPVSNAGSPPCIPSGDESDIQRALLDPGDVAELCPNSFFALRETIYFTADDQAMYTRGNPTDQTRAMLRVSDSSIATAVSANNFARIHLSHVEIDGNRPVLGIADGGLIEWGGNGEGTLVEWVMAYEPRGWSVLILGHGDDHVCTGAIARNNELGPAGRPEYIIADGISLACRNSIVTDNTIVDVTDGGIVIFQAPGSLVANNTIRAESRILFYGISMVDSGPYAGDFTGTRVIGNTIDAAGALIRHGIDMGPFVGCIPEGEIESRVVPRSRGATVNENVLRGTQMGYGLVAAGVEDWEMQGNRDESTHLPPEHLGDCFGREVEPPKGFQFDGRNSAGRFQSEFEDAVLGFGSSIWPLHTMVSEACVGSLIGESRLEEIRAGHAGPLWPALEASPGGELIERCIRDHDLPVVPPTAIEIVFGLEPCSPLCAVVTLYNWTVNVVADISNARGS